MRIVFMGTPDFAVPTLSALAGSNQEVVRVYCQPPRPAGRGKAVQPGPVHRRALELGLEVRHPVSFRETADREAFSRLAPDLAVVAAYGLVLPAPILEAPRLGCINVHASLLPRWRGAAPIQRAIQAGDRETGITIMQMERGLDTGPMLLSEAVPITPTTMSESLHDQLATLGASLVLSAIRGLEDGRLTATPQPADGVTYAAKVTRAEGQLDWTRPAADLDRLIRAFTPWPGAWVPLGEDRLKILAATLPPEKTDQPPGTLLDDRFAIACSAGTVLRPTTVQRSGRSAIDTAAFLRGHPIPVGTVLPGPPPPAAASPGSK